MNTRTKGNTARRELKRYLESQGYVVAVTELTGRFVPVKDMFGLFDLCAVRYPGDILFVQVTCNRPHSHKAFEDFVEKYGGPSNFIVKQYVKYDRIGWKAWTYTPTRTSSEILVL